MLSAIVAIDGALGEAVAASLQQAEPAWVTRRVTPRASALEAGGADVLVVDDALPEPARGELSRHCKAPLLVLGVDVVKPFALATLRKAALLVAGQLSPDSTFVAVDPPLRDALRAIEAIARRPGSVLITGPTGVGKERLARRVHERTTVDRHKRTRAIGALVDGLADSTLFGHSRGAFTGAVTAEPGAFVEAREGTLFLDEIGELDLRIQAKLLRALEDRAVRPLGASNLRSVTARIVTATNRDLRREVAEGRFRADLYFRLATFVVDVPALRTRPGDLAELIACLTAQHDRGRLVSLSAEARRAFTQYSWPGNARELRNVVERTFALASPGQLSLEALLRLAPELQEERVPGAPGALAQNERHSIRTAIQDSAGSRKKAAAELGIHRTTLWRKMRRLEQTAVRDPEKP